MIGSLLVSGRGILNSMPLKSLSTTSVPNMCILIVVASAGLIVLAVHKHAMYLLLLVEPAVQHVRLGVVSAVWAHMGTVFVVSVAATLGQVLICSVVKPPFLLRNLL